MSEIIYKSHNVSVLMYHIGCPAKYRRMVFSQTVDAKLKEVCAEIEKRYESNFWKSEPMATTFIFSSKVCR